VPGGGCGHHGRVHDDDAIEQAILALLAARGPEKTICPSEAARAVYGDAAFREHMDAVRGVAFALADKGRLEVTQAGEPVDGRRARGPIRLRTRRRTHFPA
jgi:hypothetical protein